MRTAAPHLFNRALADTFSTGEVAEICRVSPQTVIHWVDRGKLNAIRFGTGPRRIPAHEVVEYLKKNGAPLPDFLQGYDASPAITPITALGL